MRAGAAFRCAFRDFYGNSWRLVPVNAAVGAVLAFAVLSALAVRAALVVVVLAGPLLAMLVHCSVTLAQTGNLERGDALHGLRLHWRRGLLLGAVGASLLGLGALAVHFYGGTALWPLSFVTIYCLVLLGIYQLVLWTLAIARPSLPLRTVARDAARFVAERPWPTLAFGLVLLAVNVAGVAAALMPFLTLTVAYSFLAAAHFVLPQPATEEH
jgi:hypothetical protein